MNLIKQKQACRLRHASTGGDSSRPSGRSNTSCTGRHTNHIRVSSQARPFVLQSFPLGSASAAHSAACQASASVRRADGLGLASAARPLAVEGRCAFRVNPL